MTPLRLHLDEHLSPAIAVALRARGIDVTASGDAQLLGRSDEDQLEYCRRTDRVIVTHDTDFLVLASRGVPHSGILFSRQEDATIGQMIRHLAVVAFCFSMEEMKNHIEYL